MSTDKTLVVAAPEGETVTIDFAGHSAKVDGKVDCALDVSRSLGTVVLTDSTRRDGDKPKSTVALTARGASSAVCAVKANYPQESAGAAPKLSLGFLSLRAELVSADAGVGDAAIDCYGLYAGSGADGGVVDVVVSDCAVSAAVLPGADKLGENEKAISEDGAGLAAAIFAASPGVTLDGEISATAASSAGACGLYGNQAPAATLGSGFSAEGDLVVYADGNEAGVVALACSDAVAQSQAAHIVDATSQGLVAVAAEGGVAFGPAETAQEAPAENATNSESDGANSAESVESDSEEDGQAEGEPEEVLSAAVSKLRSLMTSAGGISTQSTAAPSADEDATKLTASTVWGAGSYYLDEDLTFTSNKGLTGTAELTMSIDLRGHTLTVGSASSTMAGNITLGSTNLSTAHPNLTIYDSTADKSARGTVKFVGKNTGGFKLQPGAGTLTLDNINVVKEFSAVNGHNMYVQGLIYCIDVASTAKNLPSTDADYESKRGMQVIVNNSDLVADYSKQTKNAATTETTQTWSANACAAIGIYSCGVLDLLHIEDSNITCISPVTAKGLKSAPLDAYAVYVNVPDGKKIATTSSPAARVEIAGTTTINAASPAGNAYGLSYGAHPVATTVSGSTTFNVAAASGKDALGIRADAAKGQVTLSGNVSASAASGITGNASSDTFPCKADAHYAALATNGNGTTYVLGSGFGASSLPVAIGTDPASMNASGSRIAGFAEGYSMDDGAASAAFAPASFGPQKTMAAADSKGVYLKLDPAKAEAKIGDVLYGTFSEASVAAKSGETVVVLQDLDSAPFAATAEEASASDKSKLSYAVDLNGKKVGQFSCTSGANVTLKSSSPDQHSSLTGPAGPQVGYAVTHTGTGTLTVDSSVSVAVEKTTTAAQGLYSSANGKLVANGVSVSVKSETAAATGYSIIGDADISGGTVSAQSTSGYATGVSGASGAVTLNNVAVEACGAGEGVRALVQMGKGSVSANGSSFTATLTGARDTGNVDAVLARGDLTSAKVSLSGCTLKAGAADGVEAPGVGFSAVRDDGGNYQPAEFSLAGQTSVTTAGLAFSGLRAPMAFAADAAFAGASAEKPLTVSTGADLADDVFAQLPEQSTGSLASLKDTFKIAEGDRYGEWEVRASEDGRQLYFYTNAVAYIDRGESAKYFGTLAQAVAGAEAGETVVVRRDAPATAALAVAKDLTIDLAGFDVGISGTHPAGAGLVSVANGCTLTLKDGKRDDSGNEGAKKAGRLTLTVSGTSAGAYGMYVGSSATLVVDGAAVDVYCASGGPLGAGGADAEQAVVGVLVQAGATNSVSLKGATLRVHTRKSAASADSGATSAYGIFLNGAAAAGEAPAVQVDGSSTVSVESNGLFQNAGRIVAVDESNLSATSGLQSARLKRIYPDEESQLYRDIAAKFKQVAKYDGDDMVGTLPTGSQVYSAGIYYAAPLVVGGSAYWVFSDKVENPGAADEITPAVIYAQSTYQLPPTAVGIGSMVSSSSAMGRGVLIAGSVEAASSHGDAYAVRPGTGAVGTWSAGGASLSAKTGGTSPYRAEGGKIVLNDVLSLNNESVEFYPKNVTQLEVVDELPQAHAVADGSGGKATIALSGQVAVKSSTAHGDAVAGADVVTGRVTGDGAQATPLSIGAGFGLADGGDKPLSVVGSDGVNREGEAFAKAAEGVALDAAHRALFEDATGACNVVLDVDSGTLSWGGTFSVRFLDVYGKELATAENVKDGQEVEAPGALQLVRDRDATTSYEFAGWSTNKDAQPDGADVVSVGDAGVIAVSAASAVSGVITYYPVYRQTPVTMKVVFKGAYASDGQAIAESGGTVAAGSTMKAAKNNGTLDVPAAADYTTTSGETSIKHVFVGWTHGRDTYDADELCDMPIAQNDGDEDEMMLTAKYLTCDASSQYVAKFKVQRMVYAYVESTGTAPTYAKADTTATLGYPDKPKETESGTTYTFAGWLRGYSNDCIVDSPSKMTYGRTETLPEAEAGESELFTAGFTTAKSQVELKFYYYVRQESGQWAYADPNFGTSSKFMCEYGKDPIYLVRDKAVSFSQDGKSYTFLGWSTRYNDKEPMYTNNTGLPPAGGSTLGGSTTYWGIYKVEDLTADVTFHYDGGTYEAKGVAYSASIADAFAETGQDKPGPAADGRKFIGWATQEGAAEYVPDTNALQLYVTDAGAVDLYAVYADLDSRKVTLDYNNGEGKTYAAPVTDAGRVVLPSGWYNPSKAGSYFDGWSADAEADSASVDLTTDLLDEGVGKLYAVYRALTVNVPADGGVSADASGMSVNANGAAGSGAVFLEVEKEGSPDATLSGNLKSGEQAVQAYSVSVNYVDSRDGGEVHLNKGFGKAVLTFEVPSSLDGRPVKAYWLKADGSIGSVTSSAVSTQGQSAQASGRTVELALTDYADSATGGNILIASALTAEEQQLAQTVSNSVDALNHAMSAIDANEGDYSPDNYDAAKAAYEDGLAKVKSAKTAQEAADAANAALDAMDAVPTLTGLNAAKAEALQKLADAYSGYSKSSYTDANWESLVAAYNKAKAAVNAATTADDANKARSEGVTAMSAVKAGGTSSGGSGSGGSGSPSGSSGSGGAAISSSGGSGLSTSGSGGAISSSGRSGLSSGSGTAAAAGLSTISDGSAGAQQMGATLQAVDEALAKEKGLSKTGGLYVSTVEAGGPAESAGIQAGDVITAVDGKAVNSLKDLNAALSGKKAGVTVTVTAERDGVPSQYEVTLGEVKDPEAAAEAEAAIAGGLSDLNGRNGADGLSGAEGDADGPADSGVQGFGWIPIVVALIVLAALAGGLVWWLMRRRNDGLVDGGQDAEGVPALQL